ncbi:MAG: hypothetical protein HZB62_11275 [Nitrospirae bacterium]|nr:hypothetical protein [Nitrospirota bacterium]
MSNYTTGRLGDVQKILSVDLAMKESKDQSATLSDSEYVQPLESSPPSDEGISLLDQAVNNLITESTNIPEPEKKVEPSASPKTEDAEKPSIQREGFTSREAYYQFIILHKKIFAQKAGARIHELLGEALKVNRREFFGGTAVVSLTFGPDRTLHEIVVDSASPVLKAFLDEINWGFVPAPAAFSLGYTRVQIEFTVLEGSMSFNIAPL